VLEDRIQADLDAGRGDGLVAELGRHQEALDCLEESLAIRRELGDPYGQADSLRALGVTLRALGRPEEARAHLRQALALFERLQTTDADQVRALLGEQITLRQP
jgi:tetratricopeptide (TPR) repeat protein